MKLFKKMFQGEEKNKIIEKLNRIEKQDGDFIYRLLDENDDLNNRYSKDIMLDNKKVMKTLDDLTNKVDGTLRELDSIIAALGNIFDIIKEFKGNMYEIKKIRPTKATTQKIGVKSRSVQSNIIRKEKMVDE